MATPLVAAARIEFRYTLSGKAHKTRLYCDAITITTGGASTISDRDGSTTHTLTQIANVAAPLLDAVAPDDAALYTCVLQDLIAGAWVDEDVVTVATGIGVVQAPGWQSTYVLRGTDNKKIKLVLLEGAPGHLAHTKVVTGSTAAVNALSVALTSGASSTHNPYRWVTGRSLANIAVSGGLVGFTAADNDRMRRDRGLA